MQKYLYTINHHNAKKRLDLFLSEQALPLTRSKIKKLIDAQLIKVNHFSTKASCRVKKGDVIEVNLKESQEPTIKPENIPVDILFEDDSIIVVNKPSGMVVHPAAGNYSGTLVNALLFHSSFISGVGGILRPGIVHRLDKGTSGILVVAKNDTAHLSLSNQFRNRSVKKVYKALVYRQMEHNEGTIELEIGRHYSDRKKMSIRTRKGRLASTQWTVLQRYNHFSLLNIRLKTGRTHQIRVHLSSSHHPIVGDSVYGNTKYLSQMKNEMIEKKIRLLKRPFLHAHLLGFRHPHDGNYLEFSVPLPAELKEILTILENERCM